ncbi:MAG: ACP S-malonyltransferase [Alphaproteobacteria bacterium]|nr:ACP S-malonyltransferase [Alphaproteobacteria bacterium]
MSRQRALVVCPGRGSYARDTLGYLAGRTGPAAAVVDACDAWREARGVPTVRDLDGAASFSAARHLAGEHASLLTFACSLADLADLDARFEVVGVTGNSMGWYTALVVAGALSRDDGIRLVDTMGAYQAEEVVGGQVMWPLSGDDRRVDPARVSAVETALTSARDAGHGAWWSIRLGDVAVLGADEGGCRHLLSELPETTRGGRTFPVRLPKHAAFHTPLLAPTAARAQVDLAGLAFRTPSLPLIDGRGVVHRPLWADPEALRAWTLGAQVTHTYDYDAALLTALHHTAPDVIVLLGPGNGLGGPTASLLIADDWAGCGTAAALQARQADDPLLLSFGRPEQRARLVSPST